MRKIIDVDANRSAVKWTRRELAGRLIWEIVRTPLFAWSPRPLWAWRRCLLRLFGAKVGRQSQIHPTVSIAVPWNLNIGDRVGIGDRAILYSLGLINIGSDVTISQHAHICAGTHNHTDVSFPLIKTPIKIEESAWVAADAFIGPGTTIRAGAIVAARAVVVRDVDEYTVVAGNPASIISRRD